MRSHEVFEVGVECQCCSTTVPESYMATRNMCMDCYHGPCLSCGSELCFGNFNDQCDEGAECALEAA